MAGAERSLEYTPTWAFATICFIIVSISILLEHSIVLLTNWLKRYKKRALIEAVDRVKSELMLLGFMSLFLAVTQVPISKICISPQLAETMLPCRNSAAVVKHFISLNGPAAVVGNINARQLEEEYLYDSNNFNESVAADSCTAKGKMSLVSENGVHQLQVFIFVLAVMQIVHSVLTMALGRAKMRRWKAWEKETETTEYQVANDPRRFRFTRQTTFGRRHTTTCTETSLQLWIKCFFRQFLNSVAKVDYLTLRHGFITAHMPHRNNFNFQNYIQRSLDEDFKVVVSVSPLMWFIVVIFMLLDVHGWNVYLYISYVPLVIVLIVGTKLEVIVARMALQLKDQNVVVGTPLVQPNDNLFWFKRPNFVLTLLHITLFVNAFELAFFIWVTIQFGVESCHHEHTAIIVTRVVLAVTVQVVCSYITLPLYALVTQMGSRLKSKGLQERMENIIRQWYAEVRDKRKKKEKSSRPPPLSTYLINLRNIDIPLASSPSPSSTLLMPRDSPEIKTEEKAADEQDQNVQEIIIESEPVSFRIHHQERI